MARDGRNGISRVRAWSELDGQRLFLAPRGEKRRFMASDRGTVARNREVEVQMISEKRIDRAEGLGTRSRAKARGSSFFRARVEETLLGLPSPHPERNIDEGTNPALEEKLGRRTSRPNDAIARAGGWRLPTLAANTSLKLSVAPEERVVQAVSLDSRGYPFSTQASYPPRNACTFENPLSIIFCARLALEPSPGHVQ